MYQKDKSSVSKVKFRQASNLCKSVLEAAKLAYANKTKESITLQKLGSPGFWRIANSVVNKGKSAISPLFNGPEVLFSASDKAKLFAENFFMNSNLDESVISLAIFLSRTNLKLHNISVTPKMVKTIIMNLDLSKAFDPDSTPVVVLKNWSTAKNYRPASLLSVVSKVFEKLINNWIVDHLEKCDLFSDFRYGFRSSQLTDRIARGFSRSGATQAVALDISKPFHSLWHVVLLDKLTSDAISGQICGLISSFLSNSRL